VAFYNLLSIYSNISKRTKTTNYHARLSGTGFSRQAAQSHHFASHMVVVVMVVVVMVLGCVWGGGAS